MTDASSNVQPPSYYMPPAAPSTNYTNPSTLPQHLASTSNSTHADHPKIPIPGLASPFRTPVPRSNAPEESDRGSCREPWSGSALESDPPTSTIMEKDASHSTTHASRPFRKRKATSTDANEIHESREDEDKSGGADEDDREGEEKPKRKRRRQALSCMPCKRRKIRCDRKHPCTPCVKRNDQSQCRWSVIDTGDKDTPGECVLPITSPFPPHLQPPQSQEERYVLRSEYEELKATVGRLESIVAALTGTVGMTAAPAQASSTHSIFSGRPTTSKGSPVAASADPHALYTPINSVYTAPVTFAPPVSSIRPGSSSPSSAGETNGLLKYLNIPLSGSGNSPTSTPSMSSSASTSADRIGFVPPDARGGAALASSSTPTSRKPGFTTQSQDADSGKTASRYVASPARRLTSGSNHSDGASRGKEPGPAFHTSSSASTLPASLSHEARSQSPFERTANPTRSRSPNINAQVNRMDLHPPVAPLSASRPATLTRIAPSPHPPAPGVLGRVDTEKMEKGKQKVNRRELNATAAAPISSLISARWNQRQRAEHSQFAKARKRPIGPHDTWHPSSEFVTAEASHRRDGSSGEDDQGSEDEEPHQREGSACSSVGQGDFSAPTHSPHHVTGALRS